MGASKMDERLHKAGRQNWPPAAIAVLVGRGLNVFSILYIVRKLPEAEWAVYSLFLAMLVYLNFACNLGVSGALQRFLPMLISSGNARLARRTALGSVVLRLILTGVLLGTSIILYDEIARVIHIQPGHRIDYAVFAVAILGFALAEVFTVVLHAVFRHYYVMLAQVVLACAKAGGLVVVFQSGGGLRGVLIVEATAILLSVLVLAVVFWRWLVTPNADSGSPLERVGARIARYAGFNMIYGVGNLFLEPATALVIVSLYLDQRSVALYAFAVRIHTILFNMLPTMLLQSLIRPLFYSRVGADPRSDDAMPRMFQLLSHANFFVLAPGIVSLVLFSRGIVNILNPDYSSAVTLFCVVGVFQVFRFLELPSDIVLQAMERVDIHAWSRLFSLLAVGASVWAIRGFGAGATTVAVVFGCGMLGKNLFMYSFAKSLAGVRIAWGPIVRILLNTAFATMCSLPFLAVTWGTAPGLIVFGLSYLLISMIHRTFSESQREVLMKVFPKQLAKF